MEPPRLAHALPLRVGLLGFLLNCKPSEPFLSLYLNTTKGFSDDVLSTQIYPWSMVGAFIFLLPFALLSEVIGTRPVIWIGLLCREVTRAILIFGEGVTVMAVMQLTYAAGVAVDAIYFAYVYQVSSRSDYARLTAVVLGAYHAGNIVAALLGELLVDVVAPSWHDNATPLFYLSWATTTLGMAAAILLPPPLRAPPPALAHHLVHRGVRATLRELLGLWQTRTSLRWLMWSLFAASGQAVIGNYFQVQMLSFDVPFGLLEAGVEGGILLGAALGLVVVQAAARFPGSFIFLTAAMYGLSLLTCALAARSGNVGVPFAFNMVAALAYGLQQSVGNAQLARAVAGADATSRFTLLFSANTLLANFIAAIVGAIGRALAWDANGFYFAVAVLQACLLLVSPWLRGSADEAALVDAEGDEGADNNLMPGALNVQRALDPGKVVVEQHPVATESSSDGAR